MKKKSINPVISLIVVAGFLSVLVFVYKIALFDAAETRASGDGHSSEGSKSSDMAEIVIKDLMLKEIEKNKGLKVIINAGEGKIIRSDDKIECKDIKCSLRDKNGQIADLVSSNAEIDKSTKNVFLTGETTVHFDDITINSQEVYYNYSDQKVHTAKQTKYTHPNFSLQSQQGKIDFRKNEIKMSGGVKSEFLNRPAEDGCGD